MARRNDLILEVERRKGRQGGEEKGCGERVQVVAREEILGMEIGEWLVEVWRVAVWRCKMRTFDVDWTETQGKNREKMLREEISEREGRDRERGDEREHKKRVLWREAREIGHTYDCTPALSWSADSWEVEVVVELEGGLEGGLAGGLVGGVEGEVEGEVEEVVAVRVEVIELR